MPFFSAIGLVRKNPIQKRNPLNCCCLMNGKLHSFLFSTEMSTSAKALANYEEPVEEPSKHLDARK
jgi:hypothetical protein